MPPNVGHNGECSPGTSPVTNFPFPTWGGGPASAWAGKGLSHGLQALNPPSAMASRVTSAVSDIQDWWREQLGSADGSDDDSR